MDLQTLKDKWVELVLVLLIIFGVASIGIVGFFVVREYHLAQSFKPTSCTVLNIENLGTKGCSYCYSTSTRKRQMSGQWKTESRRRCVDSTFPCMKISVEFEASNGDSREAMYYPDITHSTQGSKCSYYVCQSDPSRNSAAVMGFMSNFRKESSGTSFDCFSDDYRSFVIGNKIYSLTEAVFGVLIPAVVILAAIFGLIYYLVIYKKRKRPSGFTECASGDETVPPTAPPAHVRHTQGMRTMPVAAHLSNQRNLIQPNSNDGAGHETQPLDPPPYPAPPDQPNCPPPSYDQVRAALRKYSWTQEGMVKPPSAIVKSVTSLSQKIQDNIPDKGIHKAGKDKETGHLNEEENMEIPESVKTSNDTEDHDEVLEESIHISVTSSTSQQNNSKLNITKEDGKLDWEKIRKWSIPKLNTLTQTVVFA